MMTKDINKSIEIIKKQKLTKENVRNAQERLKSRVLCSLWRLPTLGLQKKVLIYTKKLGFLACWQVNTSALDRSRCARSRCLRLSARGASSTMRCSSFTMTRVSDDVSYAWSRFLRSIAGALYHRTCAQSHSQGNTCIILGLISTL